MNRWKRARRAALTEFLKTQMGSPEAVRLAQEMCAASLAVEGPWRWYWRLRAIVTGRV